MMARFLSSVGLKLFTFLLVVLGFPCCCILAMDQLAGRVNFISNPAPNENGIVLFCYPGSSTAQLQEVSYISLTCTWSQQSNFLPQLIFTFENLTKKTVGVKDIESLNNYCTMIMVEPERSIGGNNSVAFSNNTTCLEGTIGSQALTITCREDGINSSSITLKGERCANGSIVPTPTMTSVPLDPTIPGVTTASMISTLSSSAKAIQPTSSPTQTSSAVPTSVLAGGAIAAIVLTVGCCIWCAVRPVIILIFLFTRHKYKTYAQDRRLRLEEVGREQREMNRQEEVGREQREMNRQEEVGREQREMNRQEEVGREQREMNRQEEVGREHREMNGQNSGRQRSEDSETPSDLPIPIQVSGHKETKNKNAPAGFVAPQNLLPSNQDFHDISPVTSNVDLYPVDESTNTSNPAKLESSPKPQQKRDSGVHTMSNPGKEGHAAAHVQNHGQLEESGLADSMELSAGEQLDSV